MSLERPSIEELLLDLHLGRLEDDAHRQWLQDQITSNPDVRRKSERLGRLLRPLDFWQAPPPPNHLIAKVMGRVAAAADRNRSVPPRSILRLPGRLRDVVGAAASVLILVSIGIPVASMVRERSRETLCAGNLENLYAGLSAYQQIYNDSLPFAGHAVGASWLPVSDGGTPFASNSRHPYLLLKQKLVAQAGAFLCPSDTQGVVAAGDPDGSDFSSARSISYDSLYLGGDDPNVRPPTTLAYMSDANPLFVGARFNAAVDPDRANSPSHRGRGQSVLSLNGQVRFIRSPIYGPKDDNLWVIAGVRTYRGLESPTRKDDAFLVPGFPTQR